MAEENANVENEQLLKVKAALGRLKNDESKFLFFITKSDNPAASVYEMYYHANVVKNMGFQVIMLTDEDEYEIPYWVDEELVDLEHKPMSKAKINVGPEDILVIPEIFSNVMEETKNLPCLRVGLLQSVDYMVNGLVPSVDWSNFNIKNVITTSQSLKTFMEEFYGLNKFNIKTYNLGLPEYFYSDESPKRPVITVVGRNPNEISKLIKLFYAKYPQYGWVTFDSMITESKPPRALTRKEYADRLRKNFAAVWVDRIASFGTLPLEAMASGCIPIALVPDITPEYLLEEDEEGNSQYVENSGVWTADYYSLPTLIGDTLTKYLDDTIEDKVYDKMKSIAGQYTQKQSAVEIASIYKGFIEERIIILEKAIADSEASEVIAEVETK
jgi:glycosyltransferase involved in cell wall biosynthesis